MKPLFFALLCLPVCALADAGLPVQPYIYVEGHGKIQHAADQVTLGFELGFHDVDPAVAAKKVQVQADKVFTLFDKEKIAEKDVVAESISSRPESEENSTSEKRPVSRGFHVTRGFSVLVRDINTFPKIVDELLSIGIEGFDSIEPKYSKEEELTDQLLEKALADAHQQAEKTLRGEKMKIDSVFTISPVPFTQIRGEIFNDRGDENEGAAPVFPAFAKPGKIEPSKYRLALVSFSQTLHVIYLISPEK